MEDIFDDGRPCGWRLESQGVGKTELTYKAKPAFRGPFCTAARGISLAATPERALVSLRKYFYKMHKAEGSQPADVLYTKDMVLQFAYFVDGTSRPTRLMIRVDATWGKAQIAVKHRYYYRAGVGGIPELAAGHWQTVELPLARCFGQNEATGEKFYLPEGAKLRILTIYFDWDCTRDYSAHNPPDFKEIRLDEVTLVQETAE